MTANIHLGCSSFYNYKWKEVFYPSNVPSKDWFRYYSHYLNSFEINATFYKFPTMKVMQNWYDRSPETFILSVKAPKVITHLKKFKDCEQEIKELYSVAHNGLKEKLGCILFQLPPSFDFSDEKLRLIIENLDVTYQNVLEFRHKSWWKQEVFDVLKSNNITFCTVSHPKLPENIISDNIVYIRLHGNPKMFYSNYSTEYLTTLISEIQMLQVKETYIYFNNTADKAGILNALEVKKLLDF